jgi:hypothetical protein
MHWRFLALLGLTTFPALAQDVSDILERESMQTQYTLQELQTQHASASEIAAVQQELHHITERNERFVSRLGGSIFKVYGFNPQVTSDFLRQSTAIYQQYRQLFPDYQFSPQTTAHLLIYPDPASYLKYERMPYGVAGHAQSKKIEGTRFRRTNKAIEIDRSNPTPIKLQRLALYQAAPNSGDAVTFGHELAHLFTWDILNQKAAASDPRDANLFLNEGLSEYMATLNQPAQQQLRLQPLRHASSYIGPRQWLDLGGYPPENYIREFYSEAYLFVRWLAEQPQAGRRLQALLKTKSFKEFNLVLTQLPREQPVSALSFDDYEKYRQKILSRSAQ